MGLAFVPAISKPVAALRTSFKANPVYMQAPLKSPKPKAYQEPIEVSPELDEIFIGFRHRKSLQGRELITSSTDIRDYLRKVWDHDRIGHVEEMLAIVLNRANKVLGWGVISKGGVAGTICDPKVLFQFCLKANASSFILAHNHPSGNLKPSASDISLTKKAKDAGLLLDMPCLDHLILSPDDFQYYSFADEGLM